MIAASVGGHVSVFLRIGLGDAEHSQQNGVKEGPPSDEEGKKNQTYNPEHKTV